MRSVRSRAARLVGILIQPVDPFTNISYDLSSLESEMGSGGEEIHALESITGSTLVRNLFCRDIHHLRHRHH